VCDAAYCEALVYHYTCVLSSRQYHYICVSSTCASAALVSAAITVFRFFLKKKNVLPVRRLRQYPQLSQYFALFRRAARLALSPRPTYIARNNAATMPRQYRYKCVLRTTQYRYKCVLSAAVNVSSVPVIRGSAERSGVGNARRCVGGRRGVIPKLDQVALSASWRSYVKRDLLYLKRDLLYVRCPHTAACRPASSMSKET
jgi:hypothetical protein